MERKRFIVILLSFGELCGRAACHYYTHFGYVCQEPYSKRGRKLSPKPGGGYEYGEKNEYHRNCRGNGIQNHQLLVFLDAGENDGKNCGDDGYGNEKDKSKSRKMPWAPEPQNIKQ
jgi:hypothetical protein